MSSLSFTFFTTTASASPPRVSSVSFSSSFKFSSLISRPPPSSVSSRSAACRSACLCVSFSLKVEGMSKMVQDMKLTEKKTVVAASRSAEAKKEVNHSRTFLDVRTEQELLSGIRKEAEAGRLSSNLAALMAELYHNYKNAVNNYMLELML